MTDQPTVFVVDDDPDVLDSMRFLFESVGLSVETFGSAQEFLDSDRNDRPGCLVLDVRMPGISGLELQTRLRSNGCEMPVIVVTAHGDAPMAVRAMKNGAFDFISKGVSQQQLLDLIHQAIQKDCELRKRRERIQSISGRKNRLTPREREVMDYVVEGHSSKDIGDKLGVSYKTIEAHRAKIMRKMEAPSVSHLVRMQMLIQPDSETQ